MAKLCINVDHVATVREARKTTEPDPIAAAVLAELAGAHGITIHLREDRRHIQDRDLRIMREVLKTKLNLEMAATKEMIDIALSVKPDQVTFVPEKRQEIKTEKYSEAKTEKESDVEFEKVKDAVIFAYKSKFIVHAGHGLTYKNVKRISDLKEISELNIGHNIIARAVLVWMERAVREMLNIMNQ